MFVAKRTLMRSAFIALFMTVEAMVLQRAKGQWILQAEPPPLGHIVGVTACYLVAAFTYALGFFLVARSFPGRTSIARAPAEEDVVRPTKALLHAPATSTSERPSVDVAPA